MTRTASPRGVVRIIVAAAFVLAALLSGLLPRSATTRGFAAQATPPAPPTFVPTPIGPPPGPPTLTPVAGISTATPVTPIATPTGTTAASFSLDAVRVSKVHNPGNLVGLAAVKPGTNVWLMMYYTVNHLSRVAMRVATYTVNFGARTVFKVAYKEKLKPSDLGRFSKYTVYAVPRSLPYGNYVYHATLTVGKVRKSKSWHFQLAKHNRVAAATRP